MKKPETDVLQFSGEKLDGRTLAALNLTQQPPWGPCCVPYERRATFMGSSPQFDDIRLPGFPPSGPENKELTLDAAVENLDTVLAFVDEKLKAVDCPPRIQMQIDVAVEELFVNIANYAYAPGSGSATIRAETFSGPRRVSVTLIDSGTPYNPLEKPDPDVTLSAEERQIGGLGIFMVKKSMNEMTYEYRDGKNVLTIVKEF